MSHSRKIPTSIPIARTSVRSSNLGEISDRVENRIGKISTSGRCHKLPRTLEDDYRITSTVLGTGYNGSVKLAVRQGVRSGGTKFAVKTMKLRGLEEKRRKQLQTELEVFLCMDHPHVVRLIDVYETEERVSLVMECVEGGELFDRVVKETQFSEPAAADATRQMLLAVNYIHSHEMVHRDLKLENFMYDTQHGNHIKMIDFGFSKFFDGHMRRMRTSCGTLAYAAPEVLKMSYTSQADLWSMGVIVYVLLSGHLPFHGDSDQQIEDIRKGRVVFEPSQWRSISSIATEFTRSLLDPDPQKRLTAKQALEHPFIIESCQFAEPDLDPSILEALRFWTRAPKLQRACLSMMAWSLNSSHHAEFRDQFLALDRKREGVVDIAELRERLAGQFSMPPEEAEMLFSELEQCGKLRYSDFLAAMAASRVAYDDDLLASTFKKFDKDGSGFITPGDLRAVLGDSFEGEAIEALILEADVLSPDGQIDYQEFAQYACSNSSGTSSHTFTSSSGLASGSLQFSSMQFGEMMRAPRGSSASASASAATDSTRAESLIGSAPVAEHARPPTKKAEVVEHPRPVAKPWQADVHVTEHVVLEGLEEASHKQPACCCVQ